MRPDALLLLLIALDLGCGRGPVELPPCPARAPDDPDTVVEVPKVRSCAELWESEPTFGCTEHGVCRHRIVYCDPSEPGVHSDRHRCCSDDPAALYGRPPDYLGRGIEGGGMPLFSGANNEGSSSGVCVDTSRIADGLEETEAEGCPVPCNPTWSSARVAQVCGERRVCCQTRPLRPKDCIEDPIQERVRPVRSTDIGVLTRWRPGDHATHQDPNGNYCLALSGNDPHSQFVYNCYAQLSVADQRGFCTEPANCCTDEAYVNACERLPYTGE